MAWTQGTENPPEVIDGKRLIQAAEIVGIQPTYRLLSRDIDPRDYVWAKNGERRNLTPSQKAVAFAALFPKRGTGRPPAHGRNCVNSDNFSSPTQGQGARAQGVGRTLINLAYQLVDPNAGVAPEIRDAVKDGTVSINDALSEKVVSASQEVLRQALSQVKDGSSRTIARAVDKLAQVSPQPDQHPLSRLHTPTKFWKGSQFYCCPVGDLQRSVKPGTVDLILVHLPDHVRVDFYSQIAKLAAHVLCDSGVLVVAVVATGALPERLDRISRGGLEFIFESSLLFPAPVAELGDPHYTDIRRVALLVFGKPRSSITPRGRRHRGSCLRLMSQRTVRWKITDGLPLALSRFASPDQVVCIPTLSDNRGAVVTAVASGCTLIAADEDQSVIDDIISELSHLTSDPSSTDPETG